MKNLKLFILFLLVIFLLAGCTAKRTDITREEIVAAYEAAGYSVWTDTYDDMESGKIAYVQADHPDGDYIYFAFFETEAQAEAYEKGMDHPVMKGLFSLIFGDPSWERVKAYGCIVVTYDDPDFFEPFEKLRKG